MMTSRTESVTKRSQIVEHAFDLFYEHGFHATGVDTVLKHTGISKRTLYKYFRSKEELITAIVEHYSAVVFAAVPHAIFTHSDDPTEQLLAIFDVKADEFLQGNFRGCFAVNAKLEYKGKDIAIEAACKNFYQQFEEFIAALCIKTGAAHPKDLARQILILFEGGVILGQVYDDAALPSVARQMASRLLKSACSRGHEESNTETPPE